MPCCEEKKTIETRPVAWTGKPEKKLVSRLLDNVCPQVFCSDVDRAILGATIGG